MRRICIWILGLNGFKTADHQVCETEIIQQHLKLNFSFFLNLRDLLSLHLRCQCPMARVVFIVAKSRAWFDEFIYHDSLQARAIEGIEH